MAASVETISDSFRWLDDEQVAEVRRILKDAEDGGGSPWPILEDLNDALEGHGVESHPPGSAGHDWEEPLAFYINTGDLYTATVVFDVDKDKFYVTDLGTWREKNGG